MPRTWILTSALTLALVLAGCVTPSGDDKLDRARKEATYHAWATAMMAAGALGAVADSVAIYELDNNKPMTPPMPPTPPGPFPGGSGSSQFMVTSVSSAPFYGALVLSLATLAGGVVVYLIGSSAFD